MLHRTERHCILFLAKLPINVNQPRGLKLPFFLPFFFCSHVGWWITSLRISRAGKKKYIIFWNKNCCTAVFRRSCLSGIPARSPASFVQAAASRWPQQTMNPQQSRCTDLETSQYKKKKQKKLPTVCFIATGSESRLQASNWMRMCFGGSGQNGSHERSEMFVFCKKFLAKRLKFTLLLQVN